MESPQRRRDLLLDAAENGHFASVKRLLADQVTVDCVDDQQRTPFHLAARSDHVSVVLLLIEHGANVNAMD